jgi:hypothetical protein
MSTTFVRAANVGAPQRFFWNASAVEFFIFAKRKNQREIWLSPSVSALSLG